MRALLIHGLLASALLSGCVPIDAELDGDHVVEEEDALAAAPLITGIQTVKDGIYDSAPPFARDAYFVVYGERFLPSCPDGRVRLRIDETGPAFTKQFEFLPLSFLTAKPLYVFDSQLAFAIPANGPRTFFGPIRVSVVHLCGDDSETFPTSASNVRELQVDNAHPTVPKLAGAVYYGDDGSTTIAYDASTRVHFQLPAVGGTLALFGSGFTAHGLAGTRTRARFGRTFLTIGDPDALVIPAPAPDFVSDTQINVRVPPLTAADFSITVSVDIDQCDVSTGSLDCSDATALRTAGNFALFPVLSAGASPARASCETSCNEAFLTCKDAFPIPQYDEDGRVIEGTSVNDGGSCSLGLDSCRPSCSSL